MLAEQVAAGLPSNVDVRTEGCQPEVVLQRVPVGLALLLRGNAGDLLETADRVTRARQSGEISGTSRPSVSMCAFQR
jgi:hypothetical protein